MENLILPITQPDQIKCLIPQRSPIIMVHQLLHFEVFKAISALTVSTDTLFVRNNFLQEPGLLEHMAQTVALYSGYEYYLAKQPIKTGYIATMQNFMISALPKVGDTLTTTVIILKEMLNVNVVEITTQVNDQLIARGEMKLILAR